MDKSFLGLLASVIFHVLLGLLLFYAKLPELNLRNNVAEVEFIEKKSLENQGPHTIVDEALKEAPKEPTPKELLEEEAKVLSLYTNRVKKQMRARKIDLKNLNLSPKPNLQASSGGGKAAPQKQSAADNKDGELITENKKQETEVRRPGQEGTAAMKQIALGESTSSTLIPGIKEGSFTSLNSDQFTYYAFYERVNEQILNRWVSYLRSYVSQLGAFDFQLLSSASRTTVVEIVLNRHGEFVQPILHKTSGDPILDKTAIEPFRMAAPFLNPPQGLIEEDGRIHLRYSFTVLFNPPGQTLSPGTF